MPKKIRLALYGEEKFMYSFSDYLRRKKGDILELLLFTGREALEKAAGQAKIDVLLAEELISQEMNSLSSCIPQIFLLTEEEQEPEKESSVQKIFKYQPAKELMGMLLSGLAESDRILSLQAFRGQGKGDLLGFYSPFGGGGVTGYTMRMAKELAKGFRTLYISFEPFRSFTRVPGRKRPVNPEWDSGMSEVVFYLRRKKEKLVFKLESLVYQCEGVDILSGVEDYRDLLSITMEDIQGLLEIILGQTEYEKILFDIGILLESTMYLMGQCGRLYVPKPTTKTQECKLHDFQRLLQKEHKEEILLQILYVDMLA